MRRKIANLLTGASTVAFVVIAIAWGHSIGRREGLLFQRDRQFVQVTVSDGEMTAIVITKLEGGMQANAGAIWSLVSEVYFREPSKSISRRLGFVGFYFSTGIGGGYVGTLWGGDERFGKGWILRSPLWPLCLATAMLPGVRLIRWRIHRRRHLAGTCPACGYDLRATPERCPECGRITMKSER
jgi:hypothetical protein